jgi:anti-sigma factor RsiW
MTAACVDRELLLGGLVDGELDAANTALAEAHIARCDGCREQVERLQAVRALLSMPGVRHSAPGALTDRISRLPELSPRATPGRWLPGWLAPGLAGAIAASLAIVTLAPLGASSALDEQIVSSHVRSLQPEHLTDVQTTNRHIVKPWFNGRVDFSPPVPELADQGFPLAGGRLDSIDGKTVAAIVYHRRLHVVNLYVWPAGEAPAKGFVKDGFAVREWSRSGLRYAAVSDIPDSELEQFERLFIARAG